MTMDAGQNRRKHLAMLGWDWSARKVERLLTSQLGFVHRVFSGGRRKERHDSADCNSLRG